MKERASAEGDTTAPVVGANSTIFRLIVIEKGEKCPNVQFQVDIGRISGLVAGTMA